MAVRHGMWPSPQGSAQGPAQAPPQGFAQYEASEQQQLLQAQQSAEQQLLEAQQQSSEQLNVSDSFSESLYGDQAWASTAAPQWRGAQRPAPSRSGF